MVNSQKLIIRSILIVSLATLEKVYEWTQGQSPLHWFGYYHQQTSLVRLHLDSKAYMPTTQATRVQPLGREDLLEKEMATHSSTFAWKIPWTEEPGGLQPMGLQRVIHDWATSLSSSLSPTGRCFKLGVSVSMTDQSLLPSFSTLVDLHFKIQLKQNQLVQNFLIIWGSFSDYLDEQHIQASKIYIQSQQGIRWDGPLFTEMTEVTLERFS